MTETFVSRAEAIMFSRFLITSNEFRSGDCLVTLIDSGESLGCIDQFVMLCGKSEMMSERLMYKETSLSPSYT